MRDYKQGKIYTIRCKYDDSLIYVGSTVERLCVRMARHRCKSKRDESMHYLLYQEVNKTNWDDWFMELYQDYPCESKEQLNKREGQIIREIGTLNKQIAGRSQQEYYRENFERWQQYHKQYNHDNAEKRIEYKKQYYIDNIDYFREKHKQYRQDNFEKLREKRKHYDQINAARLKEYHKQYYQENAAKLNERQYEKITCECGAIIARGGKYLHKRTNKHIENMKKMIDT